VPGTAFGLDGSFDHRLRLTFAEPEEILIEAVDRIAAAWADQGHLVPSNDPTWSTVI